MSSSLYKKRNRTKFIQKDENGNIICYKCKNYKKLEEFHDSPQESDVFYRCGKDKRCRSCKKEQYEKRRSQNRGKQDLDRILLERWHGAKDRARLNGLVIDFKWDYLKELWIRQEGRCSISNINMTFIMNNGRVSTNVSLDRKDSSKGYIKGNVQLVCMAVNQMKNDLKIKELLYFCYNILKYNNYES